MIRFLLSLFTLLLFAVYAEGQTKPPTSEAMAPMRFLVSPPLERVGYLKGVIDTLGITCTPRLTYEQGLILTDTMIQKFRILAADKNIPFAEYPNTAVFVMVGLRSMQCNIPAVDKIDLNAEVDNILREMRR